MKTALVNARIHRGEHGRAVVLEAGRIAAILPEAELPADIRRDDLQGMLLAPGFIDTQVNGGGGVLFNDAPTVTGIAAIGAAHRRFGTTGFLPTLISDDLEVVDRAMRAVEQGIADGLPGLLGIHVEGPFLNPARRGIHDAGKFRALDESAIELLCSLRAGVTLVTLAPECASLDVLRALARRGVILAAGHTDASYEQMRAALAAGVTGFTHLFNAMSPLQSREPGAVGAALEDQQAWTGIIVDGAHVDPATLRIALRCRPRDRFMLVTDGMPGVGTEDGMFELGGRAIRIERGACFAEDGTLAGSNLDMANAVHNAEQMLGLSQAEAIDMASASPAAFLGQADERGAIRVGLAADLVLLDDARRVVRTWIAGSEMR
jgi:N-acetylglucosamine-6-phosphate deacetylase